MGAGPTATTTPPPQKKKTKVFISKKQSEKILNKKVEIFFSQIKQFGATAKYTQHICRLCVRVLALSIPTGGQH
jgi:hypothetical protein